MATVTEIYDYLRLLYAHAGVPHCPKCGKVLSAQSAQAICERLSGCPEGPQMMILAPYINGKKGEHRDVIEKIKHDGFVRARIDGEIVTLDGDQKPLAKTKRHSIDAVIDRLICGRLEPSRLNDSVETALRLGGGNLIVMIEDKSAAGAAKQWKEERISEYLACTDCDISLGKLEPRNFSFNSPYGACPTCNGIGSLLVMDPELAIPDDTLSIRKGAIPGWRRGPRRLILYYNHMLRCLAEHFKMPDMLEKPFKDLPENIRHVILYGSGEECIDFSFRIRGKLYKSFTPFEGVLANLQRRPVRLGKRICARTSQEYMTHRICPDVSANASKPESLAVTARRTLHRRIQCVVRGKSL